MSLTGLAGWSRTSVLRKVIRTIGFSLCGTGFSLKYRFADLWGYSPAVLIFALSGFRVPPKCSPPLGETSQDHQAKHESRTALAFPRYAQVTELEQRSYPGTFQSNAICLFLVLNAQARINRSLHSGNLLRPL